MDQVDSVIQERGGTALAALERLSDRNSAQTDGSLREAIGQLVRLRDQLIAARRASVSCSAQLCRANAILSTLVGIEFPAGVAQWTRVCEACDALKDMLRQKQTGSDLPV
ncbi:MAG: hypothetical protein J2P31_05615 [Blastocatellia bacterium]|nr:hypothetical protein [Blastocatellia bacterium]